MSKDNDEFDVLTFFIIVMVVLTVIVGLFAFMLKKRVDAESKKITKEIRNLTSIRELASEKKFKDWIQREREGKSEGGSGTEFSARLEKSARLYGVRVDRQDSKPVVPGNGFLELPFNLTIKQTDLQPLIRFLFDVEEKWTGSKVKTIQLTWRPKTKKWSCDTTVSIFKTNIDDK
ncbi:MAG: hypothetical protein P1V97_26650 [Planctomycetota bacterium]|nr:hypothetical protein [Planctomycetota bacterium]